MFRLLLGWPFCTRNTMTMNTYQPNGHSICEFTHVCVLGLSFFTENGKVERWPSEVNKNKKFVRLMMCQFPDENLMNMNFILFSKKKTKLRKNGICLRIKFRRLFAEISSFSNASAFSQMCVCATVWYSLSILCQFMEYYPDELYADVNACDILQNGN